MKCQSLFSGEYKKNISKLHLKILLGMLNVELLDCSLFGRQWQLFIEIHSSCNFRTLTQPWEKEQNKIYEICNSDIIIDYLIFGQKKMLTVEALSDLFFIFLDISCK